MGRVVAVTGGASGIGAAMVRAFVDEGDTVVFGDLDERGGSALEEELRARGASVAFIRADLCEPDAATALVQLCEREFGALHVACNNAGISGPKAQVADIPLDEWERTLAVNLTSVLRCLQAELPAIDRSGGGAIVNTASVAGLIGVPGLAAYSASKHALIGLTRSVALEWATRGIRVNALCPGTVRTPMLRSHIGGDEEMLEAAGRHGSPMGRLAEPEEIAAAAVWLCSAGASYVTGHALAVDGGAAAT
jgi:NAD(P)-dependent dehydrogenase (short-subunit alcohol dehydrogenase family)